MRYDLSRIIRTLTHTGVSIGVRGEFIYDGAASITDTGANFISVLPVTIEGWIKALSVGGTAGRILDNGKFQLQIAAAGNKLALTSDGATLVNSAANSIPYSEWMYIVATRTTAGLVNFYIDGILSGPADQDSGTPTDTAATNVFMGNRSAADRGFDGSLILRVYNEIWTPQQAANTYDKSKRRFF